MNDNEALGEFKKYCKECRKNAKKVGCKDEDILCDKCKVKNAIDALEGNVSLDRLKEIAKKNGYKVFKSTNPPKLLNCVCGSTRRNRFYSVNGDWLECTHCGIKSPKGSNRWEVVRNWNAMIEELKKKE